jgi:uncharacterized membrane protein YfcA
VIVSGPTLAALVGAAFVAGLIDAIAGGGGLITLPALLLAGVPVQLSLGTNKGQSVFGALAALGTFWKSGRIEARRVPTLFVCGLLGAAAGASAVRLVAPQVLRPLVLALLVVVAVVLAVRPQLRQGQPPAVQGQPPAAHGQTPAAQGQTPAAQGRAALEAAGPLSAGLRSALIAVSLGAYDGFFGPGCGTFLIVALVVWLGDSLSSASAHAKVVNVASNLAAVVLFAWHDSILWPVALPMVAGQVAGASVGARLAVRGGDALVRRAVLVVVAVLVCKLSWELLG